MLSWSPLEYRARKEHRVFENLCQIIPRLTERLLESEEAAIIQMAELVSFFPVILNCYLNL